MGGNTVRVTTRVTNNLSVARDLDTNLKHYYDVNNEKKIVRVLSKETLF